MSRAARAASLIKRKPGLETLTASESGVLKLIAENKTSRQIADELCVSIRTIENHRIW
ncbi:MAG: LuxR C-terminal-related transcriptional regulator [Blastocatellia bacterium]